MANDITPIDPRRFGLESFAEILPRRDPIIGEDPGSFRDFHAAMMRSLAPMTPYEGVIAENLVAIEWELLQHRRMREAAMRKSLRGRVINAMLSRCGRAYEAKMDQHYEAHVKAGGDEDSWEAPFEFDEVAANALAEQLADRAISEDRDEQAAAYEEIAGMGLEPLDLMSDAYFEPLSVARKHDEKGQELERRRREVRRDYDLLQRVRPIEAEVIEG
ncbi:MAG: hypothetical protein NXH83_19470 [Rhodobacteraceae bacterium]|nr:hypothetical protein [Paracoccaceae bacterium]